MTRFGYTLMTEQSGPKQLVDYAVRAEQVGFDFEVSSDHYSPWLTEQGHAPYAWTVLGAVAQATSRVELATYVTCPIQRYHPAVVAQKAATLQLLSEGRFILGLGSGENLNEHVTGEGWPPIAQRQDMLEEAATIIRELFSGELVTWEGDYFRIDSARLWDVPEDGVPIGIAVSGEKSLQRFAPLADHLIAVEPDAELIKGWDRTKSGGSSRKIGQIPICWDPSQEPRWSAPTSSSAGSRAAGPSMRTSRRQPASRARASSSGRRTSPTRSRVVPTWTRSSRRFTPTSKPASPTSRSSRWVTRDSPSFWSRPRRTCCSSCAPPSSAGTGTVCRSDGLIPDPMPVPAGWRNSGGREMSFAG